MSDIIEAGRPAGRIKVAPAAVARVARQAVLECYGVVGIAGKRLKGGRAEVLGESDYERGITVTLDGNTDTVRIDLCVVVEYGTRISEVAHNIIQTVGAAVQRTLGDVAVRVDVNVQGLRISG